MKALVIAEHNNRELKLNTLNVITAALQLTGAVDVLVAGYQCQTVAKTVSNITGVNQVLLFDAPCYEHFLAENLSQLIVEFSKGYVYLLTPASAFGKNILPRVAALLDVAPISDVVRIENENTFVRPIYAGNALARVQSNDALKVITVRSTAFAKAESGENNAKINPKEKVIKNKQTQFVKQELTHSDRPELTSAKIVISGGRGLQSAEKFKTIEKIADYLKAAVGASRAAVDSGFVPNDYQVGQTGKVVAPELYIAVGISGAIQHLAGMQDSKIIVAINKDPQAPIFEVADFGLVADWFTIFPLLEEALIDYKRVF